MGSVLLGQAGPRREESLSIGPGWARRPMGKKKFYWRGAGWRPMRSPPSSYEGWVERGARCPSASPSQGL